MTSQGFSALVNITRAALVPGIFVLSFLCLAPQAKAAFDFSLSSLSDKSITAGSSATTSITTTLTQSSGATTYVQDSFTGTDGTALSAHTPDTGSAWTFDLGDGKLLGNRAQGASWSWSIDHSTTVLPSADYEVSMDLIWNGPNDGGMVSSGVAGRINGNVDRYYAYYDMSSGQWKLDQRHGNVGSTIGTFAQPYVQGQTHNLKLGMVGTAITVYVDGVSRISVTDANVTAKGQAGVAINSLWGPTNMLGDNFLVTAKSVPTVAFTVSGLPTGATASFTPTSCSPTCTSTLTLTTTAATTPGTYPITVTATGGGATHTTAFNVVVGAPPPTLFPQTFTVNQGSYVSGTTTSLTADDNNYLVIQSTTSGTNRVSNTDFKFSTVASPSRLDYTVRLKSSVTATTVTILAFNYTTSSWTQLGSTSVGTSEVTIVNSITTGAANYRNAQGNALLEIQSTKTSNNSISNEIVQLVATP
jgi:hypothetical protein